jgi:hypothetical protein
LPSIDNLLSATFIISVPVEINENSFRTSTPPARQDGAGTSSSEMSPVL